MTIASLLPLGFMVMTSLKSSSEYLRNPVGLPHSITFGNYAHALLDLPTLQWVLNSFIVTVVSVLIATTIGALAAFAISFGRFPGRSLLLGVNIALIMVPPVVLLLPMFVTMVNAQLIDNLASVILFYACLMTPFSIFFFVNFFGSIPREVLEAGVIDGAGPVRALWSIVLPLSLPAVLTICVFNAVWAWNELLIALVFLQSEGQRTLMVGVTLLQGRYATDQPLVLTVAVLSIIPVAVFYLFSQRTFVQGMTAGIGK
jgi:ABC-type glycerol-3-phosphate transport system permease component